MAEKEQNCSENPNINLVTKRKNSLSTLSRLIKSQASSKQHRTCPEIKRKSNGGLKVFFIKALVGGGAIYLTALLGVWAEAEESTKTFSNLKQAICKSDNQNLMLNIVKTDLMEKVSKSKDFLKEHLESVPGELKDYYEKSEKYIDEFLKGKKS